MSTLYANNQRLFNDKPLAALLAQTRCYNQAHDTTGPLCYGNSYCGQILEGTAEAVARLFGYITRDRRHHHQLCVLSRGMRPARCFTDWRMAFAKAYPAGILLAHHAPRSPPPPAVPEAHSGA